MAANDPNDTRRTGEVHGSSTVTPLGKKGGLGWLWWLLGLLALLLLLFLLMRSCGHRDAATTNTVTTTETTSTTTGAAADANATGATPPVAVKQVTLPGGKTVSLEPNTMNYSLQEYLGSNAPAPRRFTFDRLNFATDSAELPADAQTTLSALQQILAAYPKAKVRVEGYADATGTHPHNKNLGAERAAAVKTALVGQGIEASRVETATGAESNPVATNATPGGRAENRRTDLVVFAK